MTTVEHEVELRDPDLDENRICHISSNWLEQYIAQLNGWEPPPVSPKALCGYDCSGREQHNAMECEAAGHQKCIVCMDLAANQQKELDKNQ